MWGRHDGAVPVGVIDVGSNTVRLLVVRRGREILTEREMLRLGSDVEREGRISPVKIARTAEVVADYVDDARALGVERPEILITSPGRQAGNGHELVDALIHTTGCPVRVLSAVEEGRLAFLGATEAAAPPPRRRVAVVDVGGGSAQVAVGSRRDGVEWVRSIDLGSQRLTSRLLAADPPGKDAVERAVAEVGRYLEEVQPPSPRTAYAVGGSARALKRIVGQRLDEESFDEAFDVLARTSAGELARRYDIAPERAPTLAAGAVILAGIRERLGTPLKVIRRGLRDGAIIDLSTRRAAA